MAKMRFPNDTFPAAVAAADPTDISPKAAIVATRRVGEGTRGVSTRVGGGIVGEEGRHEFLDRDGDRRRLCRRIHQMPVMLDTRTGEDRRKDRRRPDDLLTTMDREI